MRKGLLLVGILLATSTTSFLYGRSKVVNVKDIHAICLELVEIHNLGCTKEDCDSFYFEQKKACDTYLEDVKNRGQKICPEDSISWSVGTAARFAGCE